MGCLSRAPRQYRSGARIIATVRPFFRDLAGSAPRAQQAPQLILIQAEMAHLGAIEQKDRDLNAVAALQLRIGVDVHDIHRRQRKGAPECLQVRNHLVTQTAAIAVHERQAGHP